ncbi:MAG: AhpC/TSA family protein [Bernardetiaceae bacterium]|nr:AhpC/TSA family protein [Bernardetiaceae bacterium]
MTLQEELKSLKNELDKQLPEYLSEANQRTIEELKTNDFVSKSLQVGDKAPNFEIPKAFKRVGSKATGIDKIAARGERINLQSLLDEGAVIINFYRGGWCPYCNMELRALQRAIPEFEKYGAQLVAISPESPDNSLTTAEKQNLDFLVLSDTESTVAQKFGIAYQVPDYLINSFSKFGLDLAQFNDTRNIKLPIPATYLIDKEGIIRFTFANEDFTQRVDIAELTSAVRNL